MQHRHRQPATARRRWRATIRTIVRSLPLAITLVIHLLLVMMLMQPSAPSRRPPETPAWGGDALEVRWIHRRPAPRPAPPPPSMPHRRPGASTKASTAADIDRVEAHRRPSDDMAAKPLRWTLPAAPATGYVRGGGRMTERLPAVQRQVRIPGQDAVAHAPVFHMVDPRSRGAAGLVQLLGSMTGAVDPRCIALSKWQDLSLQERAAAHITNKAMADVAREHRCKPEAARVGPGINPLIGH